MAGSTLGWRRWLPLAVLVAATATDLAYGKDASLLVPLVFAAFVAAAFESARATAAYAAAAVVLAIALGWPDGTIGTSPHVGRVLAVVVGAALSVSLAAARARNDARLRAVTRVADAAQLAILHPLPSRVGDVRIAGRYCSADTAASVGGDFYDVRETPYGVRLVVGDVRGKGLDAVRLAAVLLGEFRSRAFTDPDLASVARAVDAAGARHVAATGRMEDFATAALAELREGTLRLVLCGHPAPLLDRNGAVFPVASPAGLPLCLGGDWSASSTPVSSGDRLVFFSDGAFEGRDADGAQFDLAASVRARHATALDDFVAAVFQDLQRHCAHGIQDDVVVVAIEPGSPVPAPRRAAETGRGADR